MAIDSKHVLFAARIPEWEQMRDTHEGERAVKLAGVKYLTPTAGMVEDGFTSDGTIMGSSKGYLMYRAWIERARFPEIVRDTIEANLGVLHNKPPKIELPDTLDPLRESASIVGESLELVLRRINEQQLLYGRVGIMLEVVPSLDQDLPRIVVYDATEGINWIEGGELTQRPDSLCAVVLQECVIGSGSDDFESKELKQYRVLMLGTIEEQREAREAAEEVIDGSFVPPVLTYRVGVFEDNQAFLGSTDEDWTQPSLRGKELTRLPFVFVNTKDIVPTPDRPPLLGLSSLALAIYRSDADYRQSLFMQGQDTLVVTGGSKNETYRIGAGATIVVPMGGDAKFIGVQSAGLSEQREALNADYAKASKYSGALQDSATGQAESGDALRQRVAGKTATLRSIALAGAAGLQEILRIAAEWVGADPEKVIVTPNLDFDEARIAASEIAALKTAQSMGAPISDKTIHDNMVRGGITTLDFEEETELRRKEMSEADARTQPGTTNPNGAVTDDEGEPDEEDDAKADDGEPDEDPTE